MFNKCLTQMYTHRDISHVCINIFIILLGYITQSRKNNNVSIHPHFCYNLKRFLNRPLRAFKLNLSIVTYYNNSRRPRWF